MRKINCKLIVSDFDGTLLTDNQVVPQAVIDKIEEYVKCGGIFAVCTGRMLQSILPRVREMGLKGLVVAYQGTMIAEIESGKIIKYGKMTHEKTLNAVKALESLNAYVMVYAEDKLYTNFEQDNIYLQQYLKIVGVTAKSVTQTPISEFVEKNGLQAQKVASLVAPADKAELYLNVKKLLPEGYDITCSASVLVEISPEEDNKGAALKFLSEYYNVPIEKSVAIGDNLNDLSMILAAGVGVSVGNGIKELKDAADEITVTNNEHAVGKIIEKFGFLN